MKAEELFHGQNSKDVTIEDNIFYARGGSKNSSMLSTDGNSTLINVKLNYNLYYNKSSVNGSGLQFSYAGNHYSSWVIYQSNNIAGFDKKSKYANPLFVNEGIAGDRVINPDLHIQPNSPAINAGDSMAVTGNALGRFGTNDYFGNKRKVRIIDIGAHEFSNSEAVANPRSAIMQKKKLLKLTPASE